MCEPCIPKPPLSTRTRISELISWRLLKKNPSGVMLWAIYGASLVIDGIFFTHFLKRKEYQVDHKKRMWNERFKMIEDPVKMKMYYPTKESEPKPNQALTDVYKQMQEAEELKNKKIKECICKIDPKKC